MIYPIVIAIAEIFGMFAVGWFARHKNYIHEEELNRWSAFVLDILFPLLIFSSIINGFEADRIGELWPLPLVGFGMMAFGAVCGFFLTRGVKGKDKNLAKTFHHFCAINNYTFLPLIIIRNLWGDAGIANLFFLNLGSIVGYWTIGVALLGEREAGGAWKNIFNPSLVAAVLAITTSLCGWGAYVPEVVMKVAANAGAAAVPCMMMLIGAGLYPLPKLTDKYNLAYTSLVRLIVLPAMIVGVLWCLPLGREVMRISIIVSLMPASVSSIIITRRYGGDPDFAGRAALATTLLSVATVPASIWLLQKLEIFS